MSRRIWRILAWGGTLGFITLCLLPRVDVPGPEGVGLDKAYHALAFVLLAICWRRTGLAAKRTLLLMIALALGTELAQHVMGAGRSGDPLDVLADLAGTATGMALARRKTKSRHIRAG